MDLTVAPEDAGLRLDVFLSRVLELSRSHIQKLIEGGHITVAGQPVRSSYRLRTADRLHVLLPPPRPLELVAEAVELDIVYEDDDLVVVNKPRGMIVHPGAGVRQGTLVHALLHRYAGRLSGIGGVERPGIVHRLDRDTSGVIVIARSDRSHESLSRQFASRTVEKHYLALASGRIVKPEFTLNRPIGRHPTERKRMAVIPAGRPAMTTFHLLQSGERCSYLRAVPRTGRTHQIRVHLHSIGHPLVGDALYGKPDARLQGHFLHAARLSLDHPGTGRRLTFEAPLPAELAAYLAQRFR